MLIDAVFAILMAIACLKGYRKGFIVAIFSILAFIAGIAAALKLSSVVADGLSANTGTTGKWLPVISFVLVFLAVVITVNMAGKLLQKSVEFILLGWVNRLAGIILFCLLYSFILSVFLFYAVQLKLLKETAIHASVTYGFLKPIGPAVMEKLGDIIPVFKNMFQLLQEFFSSVSNKIQH